MKNLIPNSLRFIPAALGLVFCVLANHAGAANKFWDNNGTSAATSGTWDTTSSLWATSSTLTGTRTTFANGDFPEFAAGSTTIPALTITVNSAVTCAGMATGLAGATVTTTTFSGTGSITISSGVQGFYCDSGNFVYNVPLKGSGGIQQDGSGYMALYANNTYSGGTATTGGQLIYYNQNTSFGTGDITIGGTGGAMVNGGSAGIVIPNNFSWPTAGYNINLASGANSGSTPGTTYSGSFPLPTGTTTLETGGERASDRNQRRYQRSISGAYRQ